MMEVFGLINRDNLPLGVPFLPGSGATGMGGMPGMGGMGGMPGMGGIPGMGGLAGLGAYPGLGMVPGMSPMSPWSSMGSGAWQGMNPMTGAGGWPGGTQPWSAMQQSPWSGGNRNAVADLNGVWELTNGSIVVIKGTKARLYVERERHQDFIIGYDAKNFWWSPRGSDTTTRYSYQMRDGRMVLRSSKGKVLLMRRRS